MNAFKQRFNQFNTRNFAKWTSILVLVAAATGSVVAFFLWSLDWVTNLRLQHLWLFFLLPIAGVVIHYIYKLWGKESESGNNLIIDEIHEPGVGVPATMAPLILVTTVITHLFGGSAGREGTAVQIGGSLSQLIGKWWRLSPAEVKIVLMIGVAAGFGAVFGTPVAGAVFALEVLTIGEIKFVAFIPCLATSFLADFICSSWGIHHTHYVIGHVPGGDILTSFLRFNGPLLVKTVVAGVCFGLAARLFAYSAHQLKHYSNRFIAPKWLIPIIGGVIIIGLTYVVGTQDYLGLGVDSPKTGGISIVNAFHAGGACTWSWLWKTVFTVITLGMGFKGGEVTPLFFIGATLGNTLAILTGAPIDLFAGLGFIAVFAGAANTPLACTLMGIELFGAEYALYFAVACFTAFYCSGQAGIYKSQRASGVKSGRF